MSENFKEMNLDVGSDFASKLISDILADVSAIDDFSKKLLKLDFHVHQLEQEMGKIEAFKRELPNCMHLLTDAIERLKEEKKRVYLMKNKEGDGRAKMSIDFNEKKNWMSSIQLWSTPVQYEDNDPVLHPRSEGYEEEEGGKRRDFRSGVGVFSPFKKPRTAGADGLSLSIAESGVESPEKRGKVHPPQQQEQQRKQRRCWSPELHKRFVDALHQLGGAQSATPKQIRELMKVDGLTNDEVKSHLQKYRIHIKKVETWSAGPSNYAVVVRDRCGELSKPVAGHLGSPQGPLHNKIGSGAKGGSAATGGESTVEEDDDEEEDEKSQASHLQHI
ncbi:hypothetical protein ACS0TY_006183 [Phlomoides rotata]